MRPTGSRNGIACHRCHKLKIKCNGERPCKKCHAKNHQCTYPIRDRNLTVSESYLNRVLQELNELKQRVHLENGSNNGSKDLLSGPHNVPWNAHGNGAAYGRSVEDPTAEVFVSKLKELVCPIPQQNISSPSSSTASSTMQDRPAAMLSDSSQSHNYVFLSFDRLDPKLSLKLPPFSQASTFLDTFDLIMGSDYHWFLHSTFRNQVEMLYQDPYCSYARDKIWLCRLLTTLAIGESYISDSPLVIRFDGSHNDASNTDSRGSAMDSSIKKSMNPPGTELFEQALTLLHVPYEEPRIEHVEVLNLISFYCYSLNRRKTAFIYAGMSIRLANMIGIDNPASPECSALHREHRKRLWWSGYCLEKNTSTEMGWKPSYTLADRQLDYPSNEGLSQTDLTEFHAPEFLTAQIKLTELKLSVTETAYKLQAGDLVGSHEIRNCLDLLQKWKLDLAPNVALNFEFGIPKEMSELRTMRTTSSLYLKYNHCIILLLRPFLLTEITHARDGNSGSGMQEDCRNFGDTCLRAARHSLKILISLSQYRQLAKYGFWESLHLFSSLSLLLLVKLINRRWPHTLGLNFCDDDEETYAVCRIILQEMSSVGNFASNDHLRMLHEIENLEKHAQEMSTETAATLPDFLLDVADWQNIFFNSDAGVNEADISWNFANTE